MKATGKSINLNKLKLWTLNKKAGNSFNFKAYQNMNAVLIMKFSTTVMHGKGKIHECDTKCLFSSYVLLYKL